MSGQMEGERLASFKERWAIPFHQTLGLDVVEAGDEFVVAQLQRTDALQGTRGTHGGVLMSMVDSVCGYLAAIAANKRLSEKGDQAEMARIFRMATIDMHISFIRPARSEIYSARASLVYPGSTVIRTRGEVFDVKGELLLTASASYSY